MPTRADVLARIAAVEPDGCTPLAWLLLVLQPLYPALTAGTADQLLERLGGLYKWRAGDPVSGAIWSDGQGACGAVEKVILNAPDFLAVTSTGRRQRLAVRGLAFYALRG